MQRTRTIATEIACTLFITLVLTTAAFSQEGFKLPCPPDQDFCALMIRSGNEAFARSRYLEARKFYRMAIASDPSSATAWALYDKSFLSHMASQIETTGKFNPFVSTEDIKKMFMAVPRHAPEQPPLHPDAGPAGMAPDATRNAPAPKNMPQGVIIGDDEGC